MTLTEAAKIIKRWLPFLVLFFLGLVLVVLAFKPRLKEKLPGPLPPLPISTYSTSTQPETFDLSALTPISVPKTLGVYQTQVLKFSQTEAVDLATRLGFDPTPTQVLANTTTGPLYSWTTQVKTLTITEQTIRFDTTLPTSANPKIKLDVKGAGGVARNFLARLGLAGQNLNPKLTRYFKIENAAILASTQDLADIVQFSFQTSLENLPLVGVDPELGQVTIQVDKGGQVVFLSINQVSQFNQTSQYPVKELAEAVREVEQKLGMIVKASVKTPTGEVEVKVQPGFEIAKATLTNVFLAYYYPIPVPDLVQPIFVFEGEFIDKKGQVGVLSLYLPAIRGQSIPNK